MSLTLVGGEWKPLEATQTVAQAQSISLRPLAPARLDDYSHRVKAVLTHRLKHAARLCFVSAAAPAWLWLMATQADDLILSSVLLAFRAGCWALAVCAALLPLLVLRGRRRSVRRIEAPTKLRRYVNLASAGSWPDAMLAYSLSGVALSILLAIGVGASKPWQPILPAARSYETWQFNEAFFFHSLVLFALAAVSSFQHALEQRNVVSFPAQTTPIAARFLSALSTRLPAALLRTLGLAAGAVVGFGAFSLVRRTMLIYLLRYVPGIATVRANLYAVFKGGGVGASTWLFLFFEMAFLTSIWELANILADVYFSQPMLVSASASSPAKALLDGLSNVDPLIQYFAYSELATIAAHDAPRRIAIYKDIRSTPNGFARIARECLTLLGRSYRTAEGRGIAKPPAGQSAPTPKPAEGSQQVMMERAAIQRESSIFRPTSKSVLDSFSQSAKAEAAAKARAAASAPAASAVPPPQPPAQAQDTSLVPAIFRNKQGQSSQPVASSSAAPPPAAAGAAAPYNPLVALETRLVQVFPRALGALTVTKVAQCMPDPQLNIWACEALSHLVTASITEDEFGVVQQELPKILEALVTFSAALEPLVTELNKAGPESQQAVLQTIAPVASALQTALARVVDVFGPYLQEFRFPPRIAARLQAQVDYAARERP